MDPTQAAAEAARRKVKRASGLLREAAHDLSQAADGQTALGVLRVHDRQSSDAVRDLIAHGVARHGAVDVIVLARPIRRAPPTTAPTGAKEPSNGNQDTQSE